MTITDNNFNYTIYTFGILIMFYLKLSKIENLCVTSDHYCSNSCHTSISWHRSTNNISNQTSVISPDYIVIHMLLWSQIRVKKCI